MNLGRGIKEFKEGMNEVTNFDEPTKKDNSREQVKENTQENK